MPFATPSRRIRLCVLALVGLLAAAPAATADEMILVTRGLAMREVDVLAIGEAWIDVRETSGASARVSVDECVALLNPHPPARAETPRYVLALADGQRLPGRPADGASANALVWQTATLGTLVLPLDRVRSVAFTSGATPPVPGTSDLLVLRNDDRLEGFITSLDDPVAIEVDVDGKPETVTVPRDRVATASLVTPAREPKGVRVWLSDGTVVDVAGVRVGDDGVAQLAGPNVSPDAEVQFISFDGVTAILFDAASIEALAGRRPVSVAAPETRFVAVGPVELDASAPLGLRRQRWQGPVTVRYELPAAGYRFSAFVSLPPAGRSWGALELLVRSDGRTIERVTLDADRPEAQLLVELPGTDLEIELVEGENGPVFDTVIFSRAMLGRPGA